MALTLAENPIEGYTPLLPDAPAGEAIAASPGPWLVAYTAPRAEKALARYIYNPNRSQGGLRRSGPVHVPTPEGEYQAISPNPGYYLPLIRSITPGTTNRVYVPLFPGIVFISACRLHPDPDPTQPAPPEAEMYTIDVLRQCRHVQRVIQCRNQERLKQELGLLASESPDARTLKTGQHPKQGQLVRIASGPARGLRGLLNTAFSPEKGPRQRLTIDSIFLGQLISVEVSADLLEPA